MVLTKPLDVDAGTFSGVLLVHFVGGECSEVEHDVNVGREVLVEDGSVNQLDIVFEVFWCAKIEVVNGDDVVVLGEMVRKVGANEASAARHKDTFVLHGCLC